MRICFLASRDWSNPDVAGGDMYLGNLAMELARRGHTVRFLALASLGAPKIETLDSVEVHRLKEGLLYSLRVFVQFLKFRRSTDIVVEEIFGGKKLPTFAIFYSRDRLVAMWYQRHDKIFEEQYPRSLAQILSAGERLLAAIYRQVPVATLSKKSKHDLSSIGIIPGSLAIVPSAALMEFPERSHVPSFEARDDTMIFIGKIRKYKHVDHAILALQTLVRSGRAARLIIAGSVGQKDKPYLNELRQLCGSLKMSDLVQFKIYPGVIPPIAKTSMLTHSKVLLLPSPIEGFGMTAVEANGCGTPVVASDGIPQDVVAHDNNGLVYPFGNIPLMAQLSRKLLEEASTWKRISENGLIAARRFSWKVTTDTFEHFVNTRFALCAPESDSPART